MRVRERAKCSHTGAAAARSQTRAAALCKCTGRVIRNIWQVDVTLKSLVNLTILLALVQYNTV